MRDPPFPIECQLEDALDGLGRPGTRTGNAKLRLPSQPQISATDDAKIRRHLAQEFLLKDLELIAPHLWMMAKQDTKSVSPLHRQMVKGRTLIVTEDPRLHLVWYHDHIFIKPIPRYLFSHRFWKSFLCSPATATATVPASPEIEAVRCAVLGYLRTYALLVKYESDFRIATRDDLQLIPKGFSFAEFCDFICHFEVVPDVAVAGRYAYGELRLSRLNFYSVFLLGNMSFHRVYPQYGDYFGSFFKPMLFTFAAFSVVLETMQVGLAADVGWPWYAAFCRRLSMGVLVVTFGLALWLASLFLFKFVKEWLYALNDRHYGPMGQGRGKV